ncbi:hypothetical protein M0812_05944 [Anaeramoeba flamelloides]|uniref:Uncharacterized protein n=1 Tax=Anaeramoeba flamelloides TaxID=1746091 RepID=A0AAV8ACX1_9EUKA|nr:hypothetical protein M0812_05944 [Anaeramoeba flamelloides]
MFDIDHFVPQTIRGVSLLLVMGAEFKLKEKQKEPKKIQKPKSHSLCNNRYIRSNPTVKIYKKTLKLIFYSEILFCTTNRRRVIKAHHKLLMSTQIRESSSVTNCTTLENDMLSVNAIETIEEEEKKMNWGDLIIEELGGRHPEIS